MGKGSSQSTMPDAGTQNWINQWRDAIGAVGGGLGLPGLPGGFNVPGGDYDAVRKSLAENFERQRGQTGMSAADAATRAGAFGGSREGVLRAQLLGDVNRQESEALANLGISEADRSWNQITQILGLMGAGAGVGGTTTKTGGNLLGDLLGLGTTAAGFALGGPAGAAAGNAVGNRVAGGGGYNQPGYYGNRPGTSYYG